MIKKSPYSSSPTLALPAVNNILLVDDLEENLVGMEAVLNRAGRHFYKAFSGRECLHLVEQHEFSLIGLVLNKSAIIFNFATC